VNSKMIIDITCKVNSPEDAIKLKNMLCNMDIELDGVFTILECTDKEIDKYNVLAGDLTE